MGKIQEKYPNHSMRRFCTWLKHRRSSVYSRRKKKPEKDRRESEMAVIEMMKKVRSANQTWGFLLIYAQLRNQNEKISKRRAYCLYRQASLSLHRVPKRPRIKREFLELLSPKNINEGWAMDFLSEWIIGPQKQSVRVINIIDECSRKNLWVEAALSIKATNLTDILDKVVQMRGKPTYIRCDNGPEFVSQHLREWADRNVIDIRFIQPGKPTQNGIIERLNGTLRKECLNLNWFDSLDELNEYLDDWYNTYNFDRPHSSLNYLTPHQFETQNRHLYLNLVAA